MSEYTPTTDDVREVYAWADGYPYEGAVDPRLEARFDRWLIAHDAEIRGVDPVALDALAERKAMAYHDSECLLRPQIRTEVLEDAALALIGHIGIQTTNGIGWIPGDSLAGAARYLRHLARAAKDGKR